LPSLDLLTEWQYEYEIVKVRRDNMNHKRKSNSSNVREVVPDIPNPHDAFDRDAIRYWLKFSDFYQWPHIIYYHSTDDLVKKLHSTNLQSISAKMKTYNEQV